MATATASLKLQEAWETLIVPQLDEITERTAAEYQHSLAIWNRLSGNPDVSEISREIVLRFRDKLMATPFKRGKRSQKRAPATVNRIMRDIHVVISPLWPADRFNQRGLGVLPFFGFPKQLARQHKLPFVFDSKDLDSLYLHCDAAKQKRGCRSTGMNYVRHWRVALALALNCGARTWDLFALQWKHVRLEPSSQFQFGFVIIEARKTKKTHRIPLSQCAHEHLRQLSLNPFRVGDQVFPDFSKGNAFYSTWSRICDAAGVVGVFESMRKTCVTRHNSIVWNSGFWLSGHLEPGVFGHYDNPCDRIIEAVYKLEQPVEFLRGVGLVSAS